MIEDCQLNGTTALIKCDSLSDFREYEDKLYRIFVSLYETNTIFFKGFRIFMKHYPPEYSEKSGLYHLIYENFQHTGDELDRLPSLRRCERITWARTIIDFCPKRCDEILIWENIRKNKKNILLFCPAVNYLVVLGQRKDYLLLVTAYPVEHEHRKAQLLKEYDAYIEKTNNASPLG